MNLPELPSPHNIINGVWYYTAEQVREAVRMEREACAAACESRAEAYRSTQAPGWHEIDHECTQCAYAIRSRSDDEWRIAA